MNKNTYLNQALSFLNNENDCDLIYATIELRRALESYTYEKLKFYTKNHSCDALFKNWQPARALKLLAQLEPDSTQNCEYFLKSNDDIEWLPLGKQTPINLRWLTTTYHTLGSYIHLDRSGTPTVINKNKLYEIAHKLEGHFSNPFHGSLETFKNNECCICHENFKTCSSLSKKLEKVYCSNHGCKAVYSVIHKDESYELKIDGKTVKCLSPGCDSEIWILNTTINDTPLLKCPSCKAVHRIVHIQYKYQLETSNQG